ncbi:MAG: hypothetical protein AAGA20_15430 [Planctomycetota bacterium]
METTSPRRIHRRQSWWPLASTLALTAAGLTSWQAFAVRHVPEPVMHPNRFDGVIFWVAPNVGPFYAKQDVESAELMFVGDSRVYDDIDLDVARKAGEPDAGLIWGPNADLSILLPAIERLPAKRMLVAISPSTLGAKTNPVMRASLQEPPPIFGSLTLESELALWTDVERARLIEEGYSPFIVDTHLSSFRKVLRQTTLRSRGGTRQIDRIVRERLNYTRSSTVRTVATNGWHRRWAEEVDPERLVVGMRVILEDVTDEERDRAEEIVVATRRAIAARGVDVHCARFPVSPSVLQVEREFVSDERLRGIAQAAGVPFHEFHELGLAKGEDPAAHPEKYPTRDGSHLTWPGSRRFTRDLMETIGAGDLARD